MDPPENGQRSSHSTEGWSCASLFLTVIEKGEGGALDMLTWVWVDAIGKHSFRSRLPIGLWGEAGEAIHPNRGWDARHSWCSDAWRGAAT